MDNLKKKKIGSILIIIGLCLFLIGILYTFVWLTIPHYIGPEIGTIDSFKLDVKQRYWACKTKIDFFLDGIKINGECRKACTFKTKTEAQQLCDSLIVASNVTIFHKTTNSADLSFYDDYTDLWIIWVVLLGLGSLFTLIGSGIYFFTKLNMRLTGHLYSEVESTAGLN